MGAQPGLCQGRDRAVQERILVSVGDHPAQRTVRLYLVDQERLRRNTKRSLAQCSQRFGSIGHGLFCI